MDTSTDELVELINSGTTHLFEKKLEESPSLAQFKMKDGTSLLLYAAYRRNSKALAVLKKHKPVLDIYEASATGDLAQLRSSIESRPYSINDYAPDGFTALGLASFFGQAAAAAMLLENGAHVNTASRNSFMVAPLHSACAISDLKIIKLLLEHGANVNLKQAHGITPLHEAAHNGKPQVALLLLTAGAEVNAHDDSGKTALAMARANGFDDVVELLIEHGGT